MKPPIPETWAGCSEEELLHYLDTFLRHCGIQDEPENELYVYSNQLRDIMYLTPEEAIEWLDYLPGGEQCPSTQTLQKPAQPADFTRTYLPWLSKLWG